MLLEEILQFSGGPCIDQSQLLEMFNIRARNEFIDKIKPGDLTDIVQTLVHCDLLVIEYGKKAG